jgi:hypothetical protein
MITFATYLDNRNKSVVDSFVENIEKLKWQDSFLEEIMDDQTREESQMAMSYFGDFKNKLISMAREAAKLSSTEIQSKAESVKNAAERWAMDNREYADTIESMASQDATSISLKESLISAMATQTFSLAFRPIRFVVKKMFQAALLTLKKVFKNIFSMKSFGIPAFINIILAIVYPLAGLFGTSPGGGTLLIVSGLYYLVMLIGALKDKLVA